MQDWEIIEESLIVWMREMGNSSEKDLKNLKDVVKQILTSGILRPEEFRLIAEFCPNLIQEYVKPFEITIGQYLRKIRVEGNESSDRLLELVATKRGPE